MRSPARRTLTVLSLAIVAAFSLAATSGAATPKIANNYDATCLLSDAGSVACTGSNSYLQLGLTGVAEVASFTPLPGLSGVVDLAAGEAHGCAALADGSVKCWGDNDNFQLGQGGVDKTDSATPLTVTVGGGVPLTGITQLSAQEYFTCGRKSDGTAWCWGDGDSGQLGNNASDDSSVAVQVAGLAGVTNISAGVSHACAALGDQTAWCWGNDGNGQLGNGPDGGGNTPVKVIGAEGAIDVGASQGTSCALIADGTIRCWGNDEEGQLGDGSPLGPDQQTAVATAGLSGVTQLSAGYSSFCALTSDRNVYCWGYNSSYRILDVEDSNIATPTLRAGMSGAVSIARQYESTSCVMLRGGGVRCGGVNGDGQAGLGAESPPIHPTDVPGVDLVTLPYAAASTAIAQVGKSTLDKKKKTYTITTSSTYAPAWLVAPAEACTGAVTASTLYTYYVKKTVKVKGKKKIKKIKKTKTYKANGVLTLAGENCTATIALKLPVKYFGGKKVSIKHVAAGNASLLPAETAATYKLKKVKVKKKAKKKSKK